MLFRFLHHGDVSWYHEWCIVRGYIVIPWEVYHSTVSGVL